MNKAVLITSLDKKFDFLDSRVRQVAEKINDSFHVSLGTSSLPKLPSLASPTGSRLRQQYSSLQFSNQRKSAQLAELKSVFYSMLTVNEQTSCDYEMTVSARSAEASEGQFSYLDSLKREAKETETKTVQEQIATDQLLFVVKKTKEKIIHLRQRIQQVTAFSGRVLKEAPKVRTMKAESLNDLTHSVYTLQRRREETRREQEKRGTVLQAQKEVTRRARQENEESVEQMARKAVVKQELSTKTRLALQGIEDNFRQQRERKSRLEKYEETVHHFHDAMKRLESCMRSSTCLPFAGPISTSRLIDYYNGLVLQEKSLNTRYLDLTETEAGLLTKLAVLQSELSRMRELCDGVPELLIQTGSTHNLVRVRIEEAAVERSSEESVQKTELLQVFFLLFLIETKEKLFVVLSKLQTLTGEDYLCPDWARMSRTDSFLPSASLWGEEIQSFGRSAQQLASIFAEIPALRLNLTTQDVKTIVGTAADGEAPTALFGRVLDMWQDRFREKLSVTVADLGVTFGVLRGQIEKIEEDVDQLPLSESQQQAYEEMQSYALGTLPESSERRCRRKLSTLVRGVLEFKLRQAETLTDASMSSLKADFQSYINKYISLNFNKDSTESSLGEPLTSEESEAVSESEDRDISQLLRSTVETEGSRPRESKRLDFSARTYERVLISEVAQTESRIKSVMDKKKATDDPSRKRDRLPALRPIRVIF